MMGASTILDRIADFISDIGEDVADESDQMRCIEEAADCFACGDIETALLWLERGLKDYDPKFYDFTDRVARHFGPKP